MRGLVIGGWKSGLLLDGQPPNVLAAKAFLRIVLVDSSPTLQQLAYALDQLACSYHETPLTEPDDAEHQPLKSGIDGKEIGSRFPHLGYYPVVDPTEDIEQPMLVGDAVDDLMDISADLQEVLWRFENVSEADAHWHFRFLFEIHWGQHLRDLSRYLHSTLY